MRRFCPDEVGLYIDLTGVPEHKKWIPDWHLHRSIILRDGIRFFTLDPFSITQVVYRDAETHEKIKSDWFYVNAGNGGHCVLGLDMARLVLDNTMILYSKLCIEYSKAILNKQRSMT